MIQTPIRAHIKERIIIYKQALENYPCRGTVSIRVIDEKILEELKRIWELVK